MTSEDRCSYRIIHEDRIEQAKQAELSTEEVESLAQTFKALADPSRLRILNALEQGEMCVCDLAMLLGITESAVSHQLRLLRQLHLVSNRREGPVLYYHITDQHVTMLMHMAMEHVRE